MSGSFARPRIVVSNETTVSRLRDDLRNSRDALDIAEDIRRKAFDLVQHGDALLDHPGDPQIRTAARADARQYIALCDEMERITGVFG